MATSETSIPILNYAVSWAQNQPKNILSVLAPLTTAPGLVGTYQYWPQSYSFRAVDTVVPDEQAPPTVSTGALVKPYSLINRGLKISITDRELLQNGFSPDNADSRLAGTEILTINKMNNLLTTWQTSLIKEGLTTFRAEITASSGKGVWSGSSQADAVAQLRAEVLAFRIRNGRYPNRFVFSQEAWDKLLANSAVRAYINFTPTQTLNKDLFLQLLGLQQDEVGPIELITSVIPIGDDNPSIEQSFNGSNLMASEMWMTYAQDTPSVNDITGMKTLSLNGNYFDTVKSVYKELEEVTYQVLRANLDFRVTCPDAVVRYVVS